MKKNYFKKSIVIIVMFLIVMLTAIPAFAQGTSSVDVRFVVKNQNGPYKGVVIQFGNNAKETGSRGTCEFKLEGIPSTTMVNAHLVDPNTPSGYNCAINLELAANRSVKVNDYGPGSSNIHIKYTEDTKTIIIEYSVGSNNNYGYKNATFKQKVFPIPSTPKPKSTPQPPQQNPQPPQQNSAPNNDHNPPPPEGFDPDMMPEENREEYNDEHFEGIRPDENHEEFNEEHFEGIRPEDFNEDRPPRQFDSQPYKQPMMPSYVWIIIAVGALLIIMVVILIVVMARKK